MQNTIRLELESHILSLVNDEVLTNDNVDEWHHLAFNEDYYLIGYWNCEQWLNKHDVSVFEAISTIQEYEQDNFGESYTKVDNAESVVNMYVYIMGEELLTSLDCDDVEVLREDL